MKPLPIVGVGLAGTDIEHAKAAVDSAWLAAKYLREAYRLAKNGNDRSACMAAYAVLIGTGGTFGAEFFLSRMKAQLQAIDAPTKGKAKEILWSRRDLNDPEKRRGSTPKLIALLDRYDLKARDALHACFRRAAARAVTEKLGD
mgnify:FL=1